MYIDIVLRNKLIPEINFAKIQLNSTAVQAKKIKH